MDPSTTDPQTVTIHYHRPPDRRDRFEQRLIHTPDPDDGASHDRSDDVGGGHGRLRDAYVTLLESAAVPEPLVVQGRTILEPGSPIVWFTFPGAWHDIGRFHTRDGEFTGFYANVLTPVRMDGREWHTTDLFLDVFRPPAGRAEVLDREELEAAVSRGWVDPPTARRAEAEAERILERSAAGRWPPPVAETWTLARARAAVD